MANYRRTVLLLLILATLVASIPAQDQEEQIDNIPAVLSGLRANAVTARSVSAPSRRLIALTSTPTDGATDWMTEN